MPITEELKNVRAFESVGFSHEQSETLADVIEESHAQSQEDLKEFFRNELGKQTKDFDLKLGAFDLKLGALDNRLSKQISDLDNRLGKQISDLAVSMAASQKDLLIKLFGIIVGTVGIAVTILKLFP